MIYNGLQIALPQILVIRILVLSWPILREKCLYSDTAALPFFFFQT